MVIERDYQLTLILTIKIVDFNIKGFYFIRRVLLRCSLTLLSLEMLDT